MKRALRLIAGYYRRSSRAAVVVLLVLSLAASPFTAAQSRGSWSLGIHNFGCSYQWGLLGGSVAITGDVSLLGTVSQQVHFNSNYTVIIFSRGITGPQNNTSTGNFGSDSFTPSTLQFPSQTKASFSASAPTGGGVATYTVEFCALTVRALAADGTTLTSATVSINGATVNPTYHYIVELPIFNDTNFGASTACQAFEQPCYLPLSAFYDYVAFVAVVLVGVGFLVSMAASQVDEKEKRKNHLLNLMITVIFIFAFPVIYNNVANLLNYLNASIIAGPQNIGDPAALEGNLSKSITEVWNVATPNLSITLMFNLSVLSAAGWLLSLFVYIGVYVLGIIRIWLLAVMIIAFPVALAIREIPFARKLSNMIEDTFYGIVLASLLSAIVIGLAANVIGTGTQGNSGIFFGTGTALGSGVGTFVAAVALLTAVMMPTILAPLTGTLMQTGQQMVMAAGSVAALGTIGGVGGVYGGISGAISPQALGAASGKGAEAFSNMSAGQRLAAALQYHTLGTGIATGTMHAIKNVGVATTMGVMGGIGMHQPQKAIGRIAPISTPGVVSQAVWDKIQGRPAGVAGSAVGTMKETKDPTETEP